MAGKSIVAGKAFLVQGPPEPRIISIFKPRRKIQFAALCIESEWRLVQVSVLVYYVRVGMVSAAYNIIYPLCPGIYRIPFFEPVFLQHQYRILPEGKVVQVLVFIV